MTETPNADYFLDITDEVCPMTFVKTKVMMEKIPIGATLEIRLAGQEPLENVPKAAQKHGHILQEPAAEPGSNGRIFRMIIKKAK